MDYKKIVADNLKALRVNANLSQSECAKLIGCSQSAVNRYEHAESQAPYYILVWYAKHFNVTLDYIFGLSPAVVTDEWQQFVQQCFEPGSQLNTQLKQTILKLANNGRNV